MVRWRRVNIGRPLCSNKKVDILSTSQQNIPMAQKRRKGRDSGPDIKIIGLRLPQEYVTLVKKEAADRESRLNKLFMEMWELYQRE